MLLDAWSFIDSISSDTLISKRQFNQSSDPRVGSSRNNSTNPQLSGLTRGTNSASITTLLATLIPVSIYSFVCISIFLFQRRKNLRVYSPRSYLSSLEPHERSPKLPEGWFNWIKPFCKISDTVILNHSSLDGFLFLRYIKVLCLICLVGCLLTWPILLPIHALGGGGTHQLDRISFGNVTNPTWYYAHALVACVFFGFVLYMICRECIYYVNLRQAYLISPFYAKRLSSRTVLFTCIPRNYLDEAKLRKVFGDSVKKVWIPRHIEELDDLVKERDQTALRLEKAEIVLIKKANVAWNKAVKTGHPDLEANTGSSPIRKSADGDSEQAKDASLSPGDTASDRSDGLKTDHGFGLEGPPPDINGSVASQWISHSERPYHRPLANYGRRVDTIKWTRLRLKKLNRKIHKLRKQQLSGEGTPMPAAFIEFVSQAEAQTAFQTLSHHRPLHMSPRYIGIRPFEVVWSSLRLSWLERVIRRFSTQASITAMIIFWSIPCAIVGIVSNIKFLAAKVPFLHWILHLPTPVLGLISGLVPAVALSLLMAAVPGIMRIFARFAGVASKSREELFTQNAYMGFQIVQVFLVTTLTSAASAAFTQILEDPASAKNLLSQNLPKASNFYTSYFLLQGLAVSATALLQVTTLIRFYVIEGSAKSPRLKYRLWHRLRRIHWGSKFPVFTNMGVIAISYSCIAPVILGFAGVSLYVVYVVYRYNLIYVYDAEIDTRGLVYPRALKQTLLGLYLAEICLIGLFGIRSAAGPLFIMLIFFLFTALVHVSLDEAVGPLLYNLPRTLVVEEQEFRQDTNIPPPTNETPTSGVYPMSDEILTTDETPINGDVPEKKTTTVIGNSEMLGSQSDLDDDDDDDVVMDQGQARAVEGAPAALKTVTSKLESMLSSKIKSQANFTGALDKIDFWSHWISPDASTHSNFLLKWLHPEIYADYHVLRNMVPTDLPDPFYPDGALDNAYYPPAVVAPPPHLWIPRDPAGVSKQEVAHSQKAVPISDEGAVLNAKGRVTADLQMARGPLLLERIRF